MGPSAGSCVFLRRIGLFGKFFPGTPSGRVTHRRRICARHNGGNSELTKAHRFARISPPTTTQSIVVLEGKGSIGAEAGRTAGDVVWPPHGESGKESEVAIRARDKPCGLCSMPVVHCMRQPLRAVTLAWTPRPRLTATPTTVRDASVRSGVSESWLSAFLA